jgi:hypothetical protein
LTSGARELRGIDRTRGAREIAAPARRFPSSEGAACSEGPLAMHPVPAGSIPNRGLLLSVRLGAEAPPVSLQPPFVDEPSTS